jgi:hypothetical protein
MTDPFVSSEVDRTKSKWVANVYREFGRSRTTLRALFYFALHRTKADYPICGGFVGEIRCTRPYHENDGEKLAKWAGKASRMGFIPADSILEEIPGEHIFLPAVPSAELGDCRAELWLNKSAFNPLLEPVCRKYSTALVSVSGSGQPSGEATENLCNRSTGHTTIILCLSDLSPDSFSFCSDLHSLINESKCQDQNIRVLHIGLTPNQVLELKIPAIPASGKKASGDAQKKYKSYLKPYGLSHKRMAELDALEVYYPRGIAGFVEEAISKALTLTSTSPPA